MRELAAADEAALRATIDALTASPSPSPPPLPAAPESAGGRVQELEAQCAALLAALDEKQAVADELLVLRPKVARVDELERELRELRQGEERGP